MGAEVELDSTRVLVAVVMANYNVGALLSESVWDRFASTVPVEVFVVDNGASDKSFAVLRRRVGPNPRLYINYRDRAQSRVCQGSKV